MTNLKEALFQQCVAHVNTRLQTIQTIISSHQKALSSETKSSAGDKHETGRAMLQLEMEKAGQQLQEVEKMKLILEKIQSEFVTAVGSLGAVVKTTSGNYYLGVSVGKITVGPEDYFVISPSSPIGKLLLGKQEKDRFLFQGRTIEVKEIY